MTAGRHFYRCFRCCHTIAVEGKLDPEAARCACDGKLELLGRVAPARRRLVLDSWSTRLPAVACERRVQGKSGSVVLRGALAALHESGSRSENPLARRVFHS